MHTNRGSILKQFSERLVSQLKKNGFSSLRSSSGVRVGELSRKIGCSTQMARKYVLGQALPDSSVIMSMSNWLGVSPGWLLFGNAARSMGQGDRELVAIDYDLLETILSLSSTLFTNNSDPKEIVQFIIDVVYDASHLNADRDTIIKMVEMAVSSASRFSQEIPLSDKNTKECINA